MNMQADELPTLECGPARRLPKRRRPTVIAHLATDFRDVSCNRMAAQGQAYDASTSNSSLVSTVR
jgi:hypothetical protein